MGWDLEVGTDVEIEWGGGDGLDMEIVWGRGGGLGLGNGHGQGARTCTPMGHMPPGRHRQDTHPCDTRGDMQPAHRDIRDTQTRC